MRSNSENTGRRSRRKSIRLPGYDYSRAGTYFVTICTKDRKCLFGDIVNREMIINDAGRMVGKWYVELENKFPDIKCDMHVIMPNHFHAIIQIVGADLCVCPNNPDLRVCPDVKKSRGGPDVLDPRVYLDVNRIGKTIGNNVTGEHKCLMCENAGISCEPPGLSGEHTGSPLPRIMQWFKTMTTNEYIRSVKQYGWPPFPGKLWQRNYYEHIVRD